MINSCLPLTSHARHTEGAPWPMQIADLSLPVAVCEPVTDMQRRGDFLEYVELLHEVRASCPDQLNVSALAQMCSNLKKKPVPEITCTSMHLPSWGLSECGMLWHIRPRTHHQDHWRGC